MQKNQGHNVATTTEIASSNICSNCSSSTQQQPANGHPAAATKNSATLTVSAAKTENSAQTDLDCSAVDSSTQTISQWLQVSFNSPPLALTQEVPDVVL